MNFLKERGIFCGIHYPVPVHLQNAYKELGFDKDVCPVAVKCAEEFLSLPMYAELNEDHINYVSEELRKYRYNQ